MFFFFFAFGFLGRFSFVSSLVASKSNYGFVSHPKHPKKLGEKKLSASG